MSYSTTPAQNSRTLLNENDRANTYDPVFPDNDFIPVPLHKKVLLEITQKSTSGITIVESRHKDTPEIRKVVKVADDCIWVKTGDYVLAAMTNRPEVVYGPNGVAYFMIYEHDCTVRYDKVVDKNLVPKPAKKVKNGK